MSTEVAPSASSRTSLGVDVGAQSIRQAFLDSKRKMPVIVRNTLSNESTPSAVSFPPDGLREYGDDAVSRLVNKPGQTVAYLKQTALGILPPTSKLYSGPTFKRNATHDIVFDFGADGENAAVSASQIAGFLLKSCATFTSEKPNKLVLAYPLANTPNAGIDSVSWVRALRQGAAIAGFTDDASVAIIPETEAVALYFHHLLSGSLPNAAAAAAAAAPSQPLVAAIVNVGHCTSSVVVAAFTTASVDILYVDAIPEGSSAIDNAIADVVAEHVLKSKKVDVRSHPKSMVKIRREATKAKAMLSSVDRCQLQLESLKDDTDVQMQIVRSDLEEVVWGSFLKPLEDMLSRAASAAAVSAPAAITRVESIGGGWRSPAVTAAIAKAFGGIAPGQSLDSNMAVAEGCAIYAAVEAFNAAVAAGATAESLITAPAPVTGAAATAAVGAPFDPFHQVAVTWSASASRVPTAGLLEANGAELAAFYAVEAALHSRDEAIRSRIKTRNTFETKVLSVDTDAESAQLTPAEKAEVTALVEKEMEWLDVDCEDTSASEDAIRQRLDAFLATIAAKFPAIEAHRAKVRAEEAAKEAELERQAKERAADKELKTDVQRFRVAQERREQGQALFKQEHWEEAQTRFVQALGILGSLYDTTTEEHKRKRDEIALSCHLNVASCSVKLGLHRNAVNNCNKALEIDPANAKALFRRGQAYGALNEFGPAKADLQKALEITKGDAGVQAELNAVLKREADQTAKEKKMFSKMFA